MNKTHLFYLMEQIVQVETKGGFLTGEGGVGMAADLTLTADADATMTVS